MNFRLILSILLNILFFNIGYTQSEDDLYGTPKAVKYIPAIMVNQADTIKCFIHERESYYYGGIRYKLNLDDKKGLKAKRKNISHLHLNGQNPYDKIHCGGNSFFMQKLVDGDLKLYLHISTGSSPGISAGGVIGAGTYYVKKTYYLVKRNVVYKMSRFTFRDDLEKIFAGNEKYLSLSKVIKYGDFIKDIEKIVKEFNEESKY